MPFDLENYKVNPCPRCSGLPTIDYATALNGKASMWHDCPEEPKMYLEFKDDFASAEDAVNAWNEVQEKHHALQQVARNNADWFDNLVKDMAAILKCEPKPHIILAVMKNQNEFICRKCGLRQETGSENAAEAEF